jgi:hypothetical protein
MARRSALTSLVNAIAEYAPQLRLDPETGAPMHLLDSSFDALRACLLRN